MCNEKGTIGNTIIHKLRVNELIYTSPSMDNSWCKLMDISENQWNKTSQNFSLSIVQQKKMIAIKWCELSIISPILLIGKTENKLR